MVGMSDEKAPAGSETSPGQNSGSWPRRHRRALAVGASTMAFALGGALAGAAAFTAGAGSAARPGSAPERLATAASQLPPVVQGSLCNSFATTATAADTAIACRSFGVASYRAAAARAIARERLLTTVLSGSVLTKDSRASRSSSLVSRSLASATKAKAPSVPKPSLSSPIKHSSDKGTCVTTPAGVSLPDVPSTTLAVPLGSTGTVSVSTGSKGASVCLSSTSHKKKHKKSSKPAATTTTTTTTTTTNPVQSVLNGVSGTVSGVTGGL